MTEVWSSDSTALTTDGILSIDLIARLVRRAGLKTWHIRTTSASEEALSCVEDWKAFLEVMASGEGEGAANTTTTTTAAPRVPFPDLEEIILEGWGGGEGGRPDTITVEEAEDNNDKEAACGKEKGGEEGVVVVPPPPQPLSWLNYCQRLRHFTCVRCSMARLIRDAGGATTPNLTHVLRERRHDENKEGNNNNNNTEEEEEEVVVVNVVPRFLHNLESLTIDHDGTLRHLSFLYACQYLTSLRLSNMKSTLITSTLEELVSRYKGGGGGSEMVDEKTKDNTATTAPPPVLLPRLTTLDLSYSGVSSLHCLRRVSSSSSSTGEEGNGAPPQRNESVFPRLEVLRLVGCDRLHNISAVLCASEEEEYALEEREVEERAKESKDNAGKNTNADKKKAEDRNSDATTSSPRLLLPGSEAAAAAAALLPNLRVLDISWSGINDLRLVHCAPALEELYMDGCKVVGDHHQIGALRALTVLHAQNNSFTNLEWITSCARLREVDLGRCYVLDDYSPLGQLAALTRLDLGGGAGKESWQWLGGGPPCALSLTTLHLHSCSSLGDGAPLASLTALQSLVLSDVGITSLEFLNPRGGCGSELEALSFNECRELASEAFAPISQLGKLRELRLCDVVLKEVKHIFHPDAACVKTLRVLELSLCSSLSDISGVSLLTGLQSIMISETSLGDVCAELRHCVELADVDISYVDTLEDFDFVEKLTKLKSLSVSRTGLARLPSFAPATTTSPDGAGLRELHLSHCYMLMSLPSLASVASSLRTLELMQLGVECVEGLECCRGLEELYIGYCEDLVDVKLGSGSTTSGAAERCHAMPMLKRITIHDCGKLTSLNWLRSLVSFTPGGPLPALIELKISNCRKIAPGQWETGLAAAVGGNPSLMRLEIGDSMHSMKSLEAWLTPKHKTTLYQLMDVHLSGLPSLTSIRGVETVRLLSRLQISNCVSLTSVEPVGECRRLLELDIRRCAKVSTLDDIWGRRGGPASDTDDASSSPLLQLLRLSDLKMLTTLGTSLARCRQLTTLQISSCPLLQELMDVHADGGGGKGTAPCLTALRELKVLNSGVSSLSWLWMCPNLHDIELSFCLSLRHLDGVEHLTQLRRLVVTQCGIQTLEPLRKASFLPHCLEEADFSFCDQLRDMSALGGSSPSTAPQQLKRISGYGTAITDVTWLDNCPALDKIDFRECKGIKKFGNMSADRLLRLVH